MTSLGIQDYFVDEFRQIFNSSRRQNLVRLNIQAVCYGLVNSTLFFIQVSAFTFGYTLLKTCELRVTNLFKIYMPITFSSIILGRVLSNLADQNKARQSAKSVFDIIERESNIDASENTGLVPDSCHARVEFKNVHFSYPNRPAMKVLAGLSFRVEANEPVIISGSSGTGKSTILLLLLRLYDVDEGEIRLDGRNIKSLNIAWLRRQFGVVQQEPILFNDTVHNNICLCGENLDVEIIRFYWLYLENMEFHSGTLYLGAISCTSTLFSEIFQIN